MIEDIVSTIKELLRDLNILNIPIEEIDIDQEMVIYGVNSIGFISLVVKLEAIYGIEFDDENLSINTLSTINKIGEYIKKKSSS
ncbi:hypothetical protein C0R09_08190 [Brevibacillus laterosporus]|uniref:acyl carrier protein n=1 Tax=Brevibacillus laterosporus TaxID=1465 RepID=UPI000C78D1D9|nr:acyl carrier protein [Brevibacillus laterosporus]AUM64508.1 hypothetical protein C0R09_08190 [Brevibacillus laterosporus]